MEVPKTLKGGTMTSEGYIPHAKLGNLDCPVRIATKTVDYLEGRIADTKGWYPKPMRAVTGQLVFAVPGGRSWICPQ